MLSPEELKRYEHHIGLPGFGVAAQEMLKSASVLVVGAGGLGCPVLLYLAAAGVGKLGIIDHDVVSISNLQRQILYSTNDVGKNKVAAAETRIKELNPHVEVKTWCAKLDQQNAIDIFREFDIIADCSDNMPTRYLVNDACVITHKTLISGSVFRFEGQVLSLNCPTTCGLRSADYRCLFPESENSKDELDCATAGVMSVIPGMVGCIQANEIITRLTAGTAPIPAQFISVNAFGPDVKRLSVPERCAGAKTGPSTPEEFANWKYQPTTCAASQDLSPEELVIVLKDEPDLVLLDVRMPNEYPEAEGLTAINIPLPILETSLTELSGAGRIIVFCKSGARSEKALQILKNKFPDKHVTSLRGGVEAWNAYFEKSGVAIY